MKFYSSVVRQFSGPGGGGRGPEEYLENRKKKAVA
jgi:hypothetical protein